MKNRSWKRVWVGAGLLLLVAACGHRPSSEPEALGAWDAFASDLREFEVYLDEARLLGDPKTVEEGYRFLPRLLRLSWEHTYEYNTPYAPKFFQMNEGYMTDGANSADATYWVAVIDGHRDYEISGMNTAPFLEVSAYEAGDCLVDQHSTEKGRTSGAVSEKELKVDEQGRFEIFVGPRPNGSYENEIRTTPDTNLLIFRQYRFMPTDPPFDPAEIKILNPPLPTPSPISAQQGLHCTQAYAKAYLDLYTRRFWTLRRLLGTNELKPLQTRSRDHQSGGGMPSGHRYVVGEFDLEEEDALLVEFAPADAPYWAIGLNNYWGEVPDYLGQGAHFNNETARVSSDGRVRIVIGAEAQPDVAANWMDTGGRRTGLIVYRQLREFEVLPDFETRVVDGEALDN